MKPNEERRARGVPGVLEGGAEALEEGGVGRGALGIANGAEPLEDLPEMLLGNDLGGGKERRREERKEEGDLGLERFGAGGGALSDKGLEAGHARGERGVEGVGQPQ